MGILFTIVLGIQFTISRKGIFDIGQCSAYDGKRESSGRERSRKGRRGLVEKTFKYRLS